MSPDRKERISVITVFLGIVLAFVTYEIFSKATYSYEPLIMKGWLDAKIPIVSVFVVPYLSFHIRAALVVPLLSLKIGEIFVAFTAYWSRMFIIEKPHLGIKNA